MSAKNLLLNGLMQSDMDANHFRILNLDTSNLPPSGIPPSINPPAHNWLKSWDSPSQTWGYSQPAFTDISGGLTSGQQSQISQVGTILSGTWRGSIIGNTYLPTLSGLRAPDANISLGGNRITNLADPINPTDAVTLNYLDNLIQGLNPKAACKVATTAAIPAPASLLTIDGYTLQQGDRVLVKDGAPTASHNGIWVAGTATWTRATDADTEAELLNAYTVVISGTQNGGTSWLMTTPAPITINVTPLTWVLFSSGVNVQAGNGLNLSGNIMSAVGTTNRISVGASIDIANNYAGQTSINTLGTITTGIWNGTVIDSEHGGTGSNNSGFGIGLECDLNVNILGGAINPFLILQVSGSTTVTLPLLGTLATLAGVETFTNKRVTKRYSKTASSSQPAIATDSTDAYYITALATNITSMTTGLTGTPTDSQELIIWIKDNGVSRTISWGTGYVASPDLPLPLLTSPTKWLFLKFMFSTELAKWVLTNKLDNI